MGLTNEAGELAGKVKKIFRDNNGELTQEIKDNISAELGDVLWYLSQVATEFDLKLSSIAEGNLEKLASRKSRGKLKGDGDHR